MRTILRRLAVSVAVLLPLAVCVLWWRSGRHCDYAAAHGTAARFHAVASEDGWLVLLHSTLPFREGPAVQRSPGSVPGESFVPVFTTLFDTRQEWRKAGRFELAWGDLPVAGAPVRFTMAQVPHWAVLILTLAPLVLPVRRFVTRRRRVRRGQCRECGYNLRNSPGRCPECRAVPRAWRSATSRSTESRSAAVSSAVLFLALAAASLAPPRARAAEGDKAEPKLPVIADLDLSDATLEQAFERVAKLSGRNVVVRWPAVDAAGVARTTRVRPRLWDVDVPTALDVILELVATDPPTVGWSELRGVYTVTAVKDLSPLIETRVYDIRDLITVVMKENDGPAEGDSRSRQEVIDECIRLITETVATDSWRDMGGSVGSIRELMGRLIITQSPEAFGEIEALFKRARAELGKPVPPLPPTTLPAAGGISPH